VLKDKRTFIQLAYATMRIWLVQTIFP